MGDKIEGLKCLISQAKKVKITEIEDDLVRVSKREKLLEAAMKELTEKNELRTRRPTQETLEFD